MSQIITDVPKDTAAKDSRGGIPVVSEQEVREFPKWRRENQKQGWRHDQSQSIHGQIVVDAVQKKVQGDGHAVVWEPVIQMEETSVQAVLDQSPDANPENPICSKSQGMEILAR